MEITYICSGCGEVESFNSGNCPLCGGKFLRKKEMKKNELKEIMNKVNGIFDSAYEFAADEEEKEYISSVEQELYEYLLEKGLI